MGESGNIVTDPAYNLELWQPNDLVGSNIYRERPSLNTRSWTFTNLVPNTQYEVKLYANRQTDRPVDYLTVRTESPAAPTPFAPTMTLSSSGTTVTVSGTAGSYTSYIQLYVNNSYRVTRYALAGESYTYSFSGSYNTTYTVLATPYNSDGVPGSQASRTIITGSEPLPDPPPAPSGLNMYASTETTASFAWNDTPRASKYAMEIWQGNSLAVPGDYNITGTTKTFTGLSPGVSYVVKLYGWNEGGNGAAISYHFSLGYARPNNFGWTITKARGQTYRLENGRFVDLVSYDEFLAFRQRINDFRRYEGKPQYVFTNVARNTVLSYTLYNQLNNSINDMAPPTRPPGERTSGAADVPGLLNGVRNSLNSIT